MSTPKIKVHYCDSDDAYRVTLHEPARPQDAGYDLEFEEDVGVIQPGEQRFFATNLHIAPPKGFHCVLCPRSSGSKKRLWAYGIIDGGYRGQIKIVLESLADKPVTLGRKFVQLVLERTYKYPLQEVDSMQALGRPIGGPVASAVLMEPKMHHHASNDLMRELDAIHHRSRETMLTRLNDWEKRGKVPSKVAQRAMEYGLMRTKQNGRITWTRKP